MRKSLIFLFTIITLFIIISCISSVRAEEATVEEIVLNNPTKTSYVIGEQIDLTGMKVIATYSDGTEKDVTQECGYAWTITCDGAGNHDGYITYAELEEILNSESIAGRKVSDKEREYTVLASYDEIESESYKIIVKDSTLSDKELPDTGLRAIISIVIIALIIVAIIIYKKYKKTI